MGSLKVRASSWERQGKINVRSKQSNHKHNHNYNLMGVDTIEINLVYLFICGLIAIDKILGIANLWHKNKPKLSAGHSFHCLWVTV